MRIADTPEMALLWEEVEPYFSRTRDWEKRDRGDIFLENTPEHIKQKYKKYMELLRIEEQKYIEDMCSLAIRHTIHGKVVYQNANWDKLEKEKAKG